MFSAKKYGRIAIFYSIAVLLSYFFRIQVPLSVSNFNPSPEVTLFKVLLEGMGPLLGAIIVMLAFRIKSEFTTIGTSSRKSAIMCLVPIVLFTSIGIENNTGLNSHYFGFLVSIVSIAYAYFEEYGWRKYLNYELNDLNVLVKSLVIGTLWFFWHLSFQSSLETLLIFWALLVFASWGFDKIINQTKSVASVACFHLLGSIISFNKLITFSPTQRYIVLGIVLVVWIGIVSKWGKTEPQIISLIKS